MTPEELVKKLENMPIALNKWVNNDAPTVFGKTAVDFFKENFTRQGFLNNGLQTWQNVKRRTNPKITGAASGWSILTGATGNLKRGMNYTPGIGQVLIYNDARSSSGFAYAGVHNQGCDNAGRKHNTTIPKRQFMGDSAELSALLNAELSRKLGEISK
jgi:phage gpG-like protein